MSTPDSTLLPGSQPGAGPTVPPEFPIAVTLTSRQINLLLLCLSKQPYEAVFDTLHTLREQGNLAVALYLASQQVPAANGHDPSPPATPPKRRVKRA